MEQNLNDNEKFYKNFSFAKNGCWNWIASLSTHGYGQIYYNKKNYPAHRISWFVHKNEWPSLFVLHACDNRKCVNPDHLFLGTAKDNTKDMFKKGRQGKFRIKGQKHPCSKLTNKQVKDIKIMLKRGVKSSDIAREYEVGKTTIHGIKYNLTWKHIIID